MIQPIDNTQPRNMLSSAYFLYIACWLALFVNVGWALESLVIFYHLYNTEISKLPNAIHQTLKDGGVQTLLARLSGYDPIKRFALELHKEEKESNSSYATEEREGIDMISFACCCFMYFYYCFVTGAVLEYNGRIVQYENEQKDLVERTKKSKNKDKFISDLKERDDRSTKKITATFNITKLVLVSYGCMEVILLFVGITRCPLTRILEDTNNKWNSQNMFSSKLDEWFCWTNCWNWLNLVLFNALAVVAISIRYWKIKAFEDWMEVDEKWKLKFLFCPCGTERGCTATRYCSVHVVGTYQEI